MITAELIQETEGRFAERQAIRQEHEAKIDSGAVLEADSPDRVRQRIGHLARMVIETEGTGVAALSPDQGPGLSLLERIMGKNDLMSVRYLELALRIARTVGRVHLRRADGTRAGFGTGFLVSPRLLLTNNHVLTDAGIAGTSRVEFDFQEGIDGKLQSSIFADFDPAAFFVTSKPLDFSLVALKGDLRKIAPYGWNGLSAAEGKIIVGEYVSIIQHPSGERKQIALRENQLIDVLDNYLQYRTDTAPGSSGSPVFNDQWEIVALHHSGVPKKDAEGRILTRDGRVYTSSMDESQIQWIANEGVRISQILGHLKGLSLPEAQAGLRKQLLDSEKGWQPGTAAAKELAATGVERVGRQSPDAAAPAHDRRRPGRPGRRPVGGCHAPRRGRRAAGAGQWNGGRAAQRREGAGRRQRGPGAIGACGSREPAAGNGRGMARQWKQRCGSFLALEHDPEKWTPVFGKDHAPAIS
jgi:endonuclease G, mitochondrial